MPLGSWCLKAKSLPALMILTGAENGRGHSMRTEIVKTCPFCGNKPRVIAHTDLRDWWKATTANARAWVFCDECDIRGPRITACYQQIVDYLAKKKVVMLTRKKGLSSCGLTARARHVMSKAVREEAIRAWNVRSKHAKQ